MFALLFAAALAADSTVYPVLNHDRPPERWSYAQRRLGRRALHLHRPESRNTRIEMRYVVSRGRVVCLRRTGRCSPTIEPAIHDPHRDHRRLRIGTDRRRARRSESVDRGRTTRLDVHAVRPGALAKLLLRQPNHATKFSGRPARVRLESRQRSDRSDGAQGTSACGSSSLTTRDSTNTPTPQRCGSTVTTISLRPTIELVHDRQAGRRARAAGASRDRDRRSATRGRGAQSSVSSSRRTARSRSPTATCSTASAA